jgi:D-glycero-D-manno-heptose 1,7-bisphosphate phosphatase
MAEELLSSQTKRQSRTLIMPQLRRYILLDRDGTLNVEKSYLSNPSAIELLPGAVEGLKLLQSRGFGTAIVTNQSGIGRGYFDTSQLATINRRLRDLLLQEGITIDGVYFCPHSPDEKCFCRKPQPGLVYQAAAELHFDPCESFVIGDKCCDIEMGRRVGATTVLLVGTGDGTRDGVEVARPDFVTRDLAETAALIVQFTQVDRNLQSQAR